MIILNKTVDRPGRSRLIAVGFSTIPLKPRSLVASSAKTNGSDPSGRSYFLYCNSFYKKS
ncbi:MAG: hypothetical protein D6680_16865 [Cyanobacteria bacterium J007]|nr:MAG: hypothetical protein D6680_16865 [Cyanobacteria bacterium J007]